MTKVLILDQSKSVRNILRERLEYEGFSAEAVENEAAASALCERIPFDVILSDTECKVPDAGIPFIALSADTSIDTAVKAVRNGAQDFLTKPIDMNRLLQSLHRTIDNPAPAQAPPAAPPVRRRRAHSAQAERIIGVSPEIEHVRQLIDKVAPCEARVLITGENGTGKELVARWLHAKSVRAAAPFVEVNCAAIPSELIESELFGHERGAFTSAVKQRKGKFEQADGGTLFMDEIGDMSLAAQAKVLRALQERSIRRVGGTVDIPVDVRLVAATNRDLKREAEAGTFRADLFYRLNVVSLRMPPLSERRADIPLLARYFTEKSARDMQVAPPAIGQDALDALARYPFPGNVRELQNIMERAVVLCSDGVIKAGHLPPDLFEAPDHVMRGDERKALTLDDNERDHIMWMLEHAGGNRTLAARLLGIDRASLWRKLKRFGVEAG